MIRKEGVQQEKRSAAAPAGLFVFFLAESQESFLPVIKQIIPPNGGIFFLVTPEGLLALLVIHYEGILQD